MTDEEVRLKLKQLLVAANEKGIYYNYLERVKVRELLEIWEPVNEDYEKIKAHQRSPGYKDEPE
jgi:hypothetical protein